ncbi:glutamate-5-semialdehyde dehydrogenase [Sulfurospirillum sp. 1612]|uniref:glutamate-5-semialdehyde dehydrogenase n=1 Tax=Sulfurospirillum sp. 1612 TaxID=3094835 RepID=UPI002F940E03
MENFLRKAKDSSRILSTLKPETKSDVLKKMAENLEKHQDNILKANKIDIDAGHIAALPESLMDRLTLTPERIHDMSRSLKEIAALGEPTGRILDGWVTPGGLKIEKVSVPIGVIGIIYESRPNVTSDTAALCFKSGNVCILKGGKEAKNSNIAIAKILQETLVACQLPKELISLLPDYSREGIAQLITMDQFVDLIIPRGGAALIKYVSEHSNIPVIKHDKGLCHIFLDESASISQASKIAVNAKCQRTGVCNAMETLLVHQNIAPKALPELKNAFDAMGTKLLGCEQTRKIIDILPATEEDFCTEYLDNILSIKVVANLEEAINHINHYGSGHSDAILSESYANAERFLNEVDSACVYVNASTRFTDGAEFGFGAEVGISTSKIHARGPMGIHDLTTYKYKLYGQGNIR